MPLARNACHRLIINWVHPQIAILDGYRLSRQPTMMMNTFRSVRMELIIVDQQYQVNYVLTFDGCSKLQNNLSLDLRVCSKWRQQRQTRGMLFSRPPAKP